MKQIMVTFNFEGASTEQYDKTMKDLTLLGIFDNSGIIQHSCVTTPTGFMVCDIWDSEESLNKFGETLFPLLKKYGIQAVQPEIYPVHNLVSFSVTPV